MKRTLMMLAALAVLAPLGSRAADDTADSRDQLKASELPEYNQLRDPFWPIGYTRRIPPKVDPNAPKAPPKPVKVELKWPKLKLKAVTSSPKGYIAIIDRIGLVEEGQTVKMKVDGVVYSWEITRITDKGFSYKQLDAKPVKK